ncbi:hypothetical protein RI129_012295 [Pyrocoelia pectoralis]|uniref:C2H2-type domain-containing protein n=1 Tax=Pyrocoelia pectoralis TaxID=417401 RepID=A0AAN7Z5Q8_9COLE
MAPSPRIETEDIIFVFVSCATLVEFETDQGANNRDIEMDDSDEATVFLQEGQFVVPVTRHAVLLEDSQGVLEQYLVNDGELYVHEEENDTKIENPIVFYTKDEKYCDEEPYTFIFPDGNLHLQTVQMEEEPTEITPEEDLEQSIKIDDDTCTIDLNKITGRNLVTGQTVTLENYFEKLQKQLLSVESGEDGVDGGLINKKVTIGKTASGKKIVGKILHFQTSENADKTSSLSVTNVIVSIFVCQEASKSHQPALRKRCILTKENCDVNIGKTLAGLMDLETVRNKLRNKNLGVKIVDKVYNVQTKDFVKTISYVYGRMELTNNDDWSFEVQGKLITKETPPPFLSFFRLHDCPKCPKSFNSAGSLKRHLTVHDPSLRPLECTVCSQRFMDESSLRKHLLIHTGIRAYACNICARAFRNRGDLNFHRRIHDPVKQFCCEICGRAFSRYSNMLPLHHCDICGCSYSFVSSLTRHIVQKHLNCEET